MDKVWEALDEEFGQVIEIVSSLGKGLIAFKNSKNARSDSHTFKEPWRK